MFKSSPLSGVGQGNIRGLFIDTLLLDENISQEYLDIINTLSVNEDVPWEYLHNGYIQVLTADGIIAFTVFAALVLTVLIKGAAKTIDAIRGKYGNGLKVFTAFAALLTILTYNLVEGNLLMEYKHVGVLFWLIAGYLCFRTEPVKHKN